MPGKQTRCPDHTARTELANRGETSVVTADQTCLALQQNKDAGWNMVRVTELLAQLKAQGIRTQLKLLGPIFGKTPKSRVIQQGK